MLALDGIAGPPVGGIDPSWAGRQVQVKLPKRTGHGVWIGATTLPPVTADRQIASSGIVRIVW